MANVLTGLYPVLFQAANVVSRELIGMVSTVSKSAMAEEAGTGTSGT